jgi:rRNA maturation RNase YbeY
MGGARAGQPHPRGRLAIRIVGAKEGRALNRHYRGKDYATNVLSFPAELPEGLPKGVRLPLLGDLVICAPVVAREAKEQKKRLVAHYAHLTVHGALHLLGWDHENERDADLHGTARARDPGDHGHRRPYPRLRAGFPAGLPAAFPALR